jgi:hypothetical protein
MTHSNASLLRFMLREVDAIDLAGQQGVSSGYV